MNRTWAAATTAARRLETTVASEDYGPKCESSSRDEQLPPDGLPSGDSDSTGRAMSVQPGHGAESVGAHGRRPDARPLGDV